MAEKRMISKVISISKKVNLRLDNHFARLLYTWMIPHADDFGRMQGSPHQVRGIVIPLLNETWQDVEAALSEMDNVGLIHWYEIDGEQYIQLINFEEHQSGLHKRTKSKFPEFPGKSENFTEIPLELKGTELKGKGTEEEQKGREMPAIPSDNPDKDYILKIINENQIIYNNFFTLEKIYSYIGLADIEVFDAAIKKSHGKNINYCLATLEGMIKEGLTKKEHLHQLVTPGTNVHHLPRRGTGSGKPQIPVAQIERGSVLSEEERSEIRRVARELDETLNKRTADS